MDVKADAFAYDGTIPADGAVVIYAATDAEAREISQRHATAGARALTSDADPKTYCEAVEDLGRTHRIVVAVDHFPGVAGRASCAPAVIFTEGFLKARGG